jgi:hypothetical protein
MKPLRLGDSRAIQFTLTRNTQGIYVHSPLPDDEVERRKKAIDQRKAKDKRRKKIADKARKKN